jgi:ubiquinone/menaquinone biosynthesis C-methylase UbiE
MPDPNFGIHPATDPELLHQMAFSFIPSRVLSAGLQLGVFSHIAAGKKTAKEVAAAAQASECGIRMLLDALVAVQLLARNGPGYELAPLASQFLVRESPDYLGRLFEQEELWQSWGHLTDVIRSGRPLLRVEDQALAEQFFPILVQTLHVLHRDRARRLAGALGVGNHSKGLRVVDVGAGSGIWGIAVAERDAKTRVTAQDFPAMLNVTREYLKRHGVERQFDFLPGDLKIVDFGHEQYDLALLGNILHSEGEESSRNLLQRLHAALRPGGRVVIIDMLPNDDRTGPPFPIFFALNMLLHTEHGDTYSLAEYTRWLARAGFPRVETIDIGSHSPVVIGYRD